MCPFLGSEKIQYDDGAVLALLRESPHLASMRFTYRCGIGESYPLALVIALGGSLTVVQLMVNACPDALKEKLSGKRNVLHYAIAEGVDIEIVKYLTTQNPNLVLEVDSFNAIPLHLASTYPSSSLSVLNHLLHIHPEGAKCLDNKLLTPLHRACRSRVSIQKVQALIQACPEVLSWKDWLQTTPLEWAERVDHRLSDSIPEIVEMLEMMTDILVLGSKEGGYEEEHITTNDHDKYRAQHILLHFQSINYWGGIRLAFARNIKLMALLDLDIEMIPKLLSLLSIDGDITQLNDTSGGEDGSSAALTLSIESIFSVLVQCPDVVGRARCTI